FLCKKMKKERLKMKTAKNDPGLKVGDKIRHRCTWIDENDKLVTGNYGEIFTITKVNSRSFYTERKEGTAKFSTSDGWDYISFQKEEDDVWMATASLGKIPQSEKQS
ncbi:MAG: hypothetical protein PHW17_13595, partial [Desulfobacterales bacterium]|nr:hypothetical protein [Desulfobacterales bacterium]